MPRVPAKIGNKTLFILSGLLVWAFVLVVFIGRAQAAREITVVLELDSREAILQDPIRMTIKVSGSKKVDHNPQISGLENFRVSTGGTSTRIQIINGRISSGVDYTYIIQPKKLGVFTIGPASINISGRIYKSNSVLLKVVGAATGAQGESLPALVLTSHLSKDQAFIEEQIFYTTKLYFQRRISDLSLDLPELDSLTFTQLEKPRQYKGVYKGASYNILEIRYSLTASKPGVFKLDAPRMGLLVYENKRRRRGRFDSIFNDPFFASGSPANVFGQSIDLTVSELPEQGRPENFSGLVGSFNISSQLAPSQIKERDSSTITVQINGIGNVKRMPDLKVEEIESIKIYTDNPVLTSEITPHGLTGTKTMKWALVPEKAGKYHIPVSSVSYFDPLDGKYKQLAIKPFVLTVLQAAKQETLVKTDSTPVQAKSKKRQIEQLGQDILPIHTSMRALKSKPLIHPERFTAWVALLLPALFFLIVFFFKQTQKKSVESIIDSKSKKAAKNFVKTVGAKELNSQEFSSAITGFFNDRFNLNLGTVTSNEAREILVEYRCSNQTAESMALAIKNMESIIYSGQGTQPYENPQTIVELIKRINKEAR